jgi:hypothetical protein
VRSRRTIAYAVLAALAVVLAIVVGWLTAPGTEGLEGDWETAAVDGEVLGGRALVADDTNVAIDLVTGTRITLGSVRGGSKAIGAGRLLVLRETTVDGAGLDGRSRWTWQGPPSHRLTLVAADATTTVVQACGGTPEACRLIGIGGNGKESWQTPQPTASGTEAPVVGSDGNLPTVGVFPTDDRTVVLLDPTTSRVVLRPPASASVGRDGALTLTVESGGQCRHTTFETIDRSTTSTTPAPCDLPADPSAAAATRVTAGRTHAWWWPFGNGRRTLEVSGRHTGRVVGGDPLRELRRDDEGLTALDGGTVRRYTWVSGD